MSSFAKQQLEKYGWSEGKGLGKLENGLVKPLKPVLKFDTYGIGHDESKLWTSKWWSNIFNDASKRIKVVKNETGVQVSCETKALESSYPLDATYKNFVKSAIMKEEQLSLSDELKSISSSPNAKSSYSNKKEIKKQERRKNLVQKYMQPNRKQKKKRS